MLLAQLCFAFNQQIEIHWFNRAQPWRMPPMDFPIVLTRAVLQAHQPKSRLEECVDSTARTTQSNFSRKITRMEYLGRSQSNWCEMIDFASFFVQENEWIPMQLWRDVTPTDRSGQETRGVSRWIQPTYIAFDGFHHERMLTQSKEIGKFGGVLPRFFSSSLESWFSPMRSAESAITNWGVPYMGNPQ